jgi:hypothetical protein
MTHRRLRYRTPTSRAQALLAASKLAQSASSSAYTNVKLCLAADFFAARRKAALHHDPRWPTQAATAVQLQSGTNSKAAI